MLSKELEKIGNNVGPLDKLRQLGATANSNAGAYDVALNQAKNNPEYRHQQEIATPGSTDMHANARDFKNQLMGEFGEMKNTGKDMLSRLTTTSVDRNTLRGMYADPQLRGLLTTEQWASVYDPVHDKVIGSEEAVKGLISHATSKATELEQAGDLRSNLGAAAEDRLLGSGTSIAMQDNEMQAFVGRAMQDPEMMKMMQTLYRNGELSYDPSNMMMTASDGSKHMNWSHDRLMKTKEEIENALLGTQRAHEYLRKHPEAFKAVSGGKTMDDYFHNASGVNEFDMTKKNIQYLKDHKDPTKFYEADISKRMEPVTNLDGEQYKIIKHLYDTGNTSKMMDMGINPDDFKTFLEKNPSVYSHKSDAEVDKLVNGVKDWEGQHRFDGIKEFGGNIREGAEDAGRAVSNMFSGIKAPSFPQHEQASAAPVAHNGPDIDINVPDIGKGFNEGMGKFVDMFKGRDDVPASIVPQVEAHSGNLEAGLAGAGAGGLIGGMLGHNSDHRTEEERANNRVTGAAAGAGLGSLATLLLNHATKQANYYGNDPELSRGGKQDIYGVRPGEEQLKEHIRNRVNSEMEREMLKRTEGTNYSAYENGNEITDNLYRQSHNPAYSGGLGEQARKMVNDQIDDHVGKINSTQFASREPGELNGRKTNPDDYYKEHGDPTHGGMSDPSLVTYRAPSQVAKKVTTSHPVKHQDATPTATTTATTTTAPVQQAATQGQFDQHMRDIGITGSAPGNGLGIGANIDRPFGPVRTGLDGAGKTITGGPISEHIDVPKVPQINGQRVNAAGNELIGSAADHMANAAENASTSLTNTVGSAGLGALLGYTGGSMMGGKDELERRNNRNRGMLAGAAAMPLGNMAINHIIDNVVKG